MEVSCFSSRLSFRSGQGKGRLAAHSGFTLLPPAPGPYLLLMQLERRQQTHTCTFTYTTRVHSYTLTPKLTPAHMNSCTLTHIPTHAIHTHTHLGTHAHAHSHAHTLPHPDTLSHTHFPMCARMNAHSPPFMQSHNHTHTCSPVHILAHVCKHTLQHTHSHTLLSGMVGLRSMEFSSRMLLNACYSGPGQPQLPGS